MGVFIGTLLGAEGEREQLTLSCSVGVDVLSSFIVNENQIDIKYKGKMHQNYCLCNHICSE